MTREGSLYNFFNGFGIPAYPKTSVPNEAEFPYITYETTGSFWGDAETNISADIWYKTESEAEPNKKVREISEKIGCGGVVIDYDEGSMWIRRGVPWCVSLSDSSDTTIKRRNLNIVIEDWRI